MTIIHKAVLVYCQINAHMLTEWTSFEKDQILKLFKRLLTIIV